MVAVSVAFKEFDGQKSLKIIPGSSQKRARRRHVPARTGEKRWNGRVGWVVRAETAVQSSTPVPVPTNDDSTLDSSSHL